MKQILLNRYSVEDRVSMEPTSGCWIFTGPMLANGYGAWKVKGIKQNLAHRVSYFIFNGKNPSSSEFICHKCDNRICINQDHLFLGNASLNTRDMISKGRGNYISKGGRKPNNNPKTHCINGHEFTPENTKIQRSSTKGRFRNCRICIRLRKARIRLRKSGKVQ